MHHDEKYAVHDYDLSNLSSSASTSKPHLMQEEAVHTKLTLVNAYLEGQVL
jgi:hypothetical protein